MMIRRALLACVAAAFSTAVVSAQTPGRTVISPELIASLDQEKGVVYARYGDRELQLDLFRPKHGAEPLPAVVCIHGGGWAKGERSSMTPLAQALAARGFVAVTISYRLSGEAIFPAAIQDCKAAVRWLRANAAKYHVDPDAIGATGLSAGGHLAALLATSGDVSELEGDGGNAACSSRVQAVVAMGAQTDLESERIRALSREPQDLYYRAFLGGSYDERPAAFAAASPRHYLDANDPPLSFITGELDDASTHADDLRADLERRGVPTGLTIIPQAPHGFLGQQQWFDAALNAMTSFFDHYLRARPAARS